MSTLSTANIQSKAANTPPVIKDLNGTECGTFCRAWVNFAGNTGTQGQSDVTIRDSFNVSSVTDNGTGQYDVNFTNAMPNANYCILGLSSAEEELIWSAPTTTEFEIATRLSTGVTDTSYVCAAVFGG